MIIKSNSFDSGVLADKVGQLTLSKEDLINFNTSLLAKAKDEGYDLLFLQSPEILLDLETHYMGYLSSLEVDTTTLETKFSRFKNRFSLRDVKKEDWNIILPFISQYSSPTRFSQDHKISDETVHNHKLKLLQERAKSGTLLLAEKDGELIGLQCSYKDNSHFQFYEITVHPNYRVGFLALELLKTAYEKLNTTDIKKVYTAIYSHNLSSLSLFQHLGFQETSRTHHYHIWL